MQHAREDDATIKDIVYDASHEVGFLDINGISEPEAIGYAMFLGFVACGAVTGLIYVGIRLVGV